MNFSQNLLKKIHVDGLARAVNATLRPPGMGGAVDKEAMRQLLAMLPFSRVEERGMELYAMDPGSPQGKILVLDNELAIYSGTTVQDVGMRKNPVIREMVKIRNMRKILSDKDVVTSRRQDSVDVLASMILEGLDLSFDGKDVENIRAAGARALREGSMEGVLEAIALFCELLEYEDHPFARKQSGITARGVLDKTKAESSLFGPCVVFVHTDFRLLWLENVLDLSKKENKEYFGVVAKGDRPATESGAAVFDVLAKAVIDKHLLAQGGRADLKNR